MTSRAPVYILNQNAKREQGRKAQAANIKAARVRDYHWYIPLRIGRIRHRAHDPRTQIHAQDAPRPDGRHRANQRRQRHPQRGKETHTNTIKMLCRLMLHTQQLRA